MKTTHLNRRPPTQNGGFSWGRFPMPNQAGTAPRVIYRHFRRDHTGLLHMDELKFFEGESRSEIAKAARDQRHKLRDRVDEIDLAAMGIAA